MRVLAAVLFVVPYALAQFCGPDEIPDKLAINQNGEVALGCRYNECPRSYNDAGVKNDAPPKCGKRYYELSCGGPLQWVGGIPRGSNLNNVVPLQCCTAQKLRDSPAGESSKIVEPGQVFEGQVHYDKTGHVLAYDIIKNAQKVRLGEGRYAMSVTVSRLMCHNNKRQFQLEANQAEQQFGPIDTFEGPLNAPADGSFQGFPLSPLGDQFGGIEQFAGQIPPQLGGDLAGFAPELVQGLPGIAQQGIPAAVGPEVGLAGLAAGGGGVGCFTGDTMVETPSGPKSMDQLKIGDQVLAVSHDSIIGFSPVKSFLHRLPNQEAEFHRITAGGNSVSLTPQHFIYTTPCDQVTPKMKYARDVVPGKECLLKIVGERQVPVPVESNEIFRSTGVYNPMTEAGTIVADGFMTSIHNVLEDNSFMNTFMQTVQDVQHWLSGKTSESHVELPWALQYAIDYASKIF